MIRKIILIGLMSLVLMVGVFVAVSCGKPKPIPTPAVPPAPTQKSTIFGKQGISGVYIECSEAKGKIELTHSVTRGFNESSVSPAPAIKITIKNISDKPIEISGRGEKYDSFYLEVTSKDKNGRVLGQPNFLSFYLQPKEVSVQGVSLFSSDETKGYEIRLEYKSPPKTSGAYIESAEAKGKIAITHSLKAESWGALSLKGEVKNISNKDIGWIWRGGGDPWIQEDWFVNATFKDASGKVIGSEGTIIAGWRQFKPGEVIQFTFKVPEGIKDYEITVVKKTKST